MQIYCKICKNYITIFSMCGHPSTDQTHILMEEEAIYCGLDILERPYVVVLGDTTGEIKENILRNRRHPAIKEIIAAGAASVPFIKEEIERGRGHWYEPLRLILNDLPHVPEGDRGKIQRLNTIYLEWLKEKGY